MKKLKDKTIIVICSICMTLMCCFGISYKYANKTYADTVPTTKQEIGKWLSALLASYGARIYINAVQGYEWLVDNFNAVMTSNNIVYTALDLATAMNDSYNSVDNTLTLDEEPSHSISVYLETFVNQAGLREGSEDTDIGNYEVEILGTYMAMIPNQIYLVRTYNGTDMYAQVSKECRASWFTNGSRKNFIVFSLDGTAQVRWKYGADSWMNWYGPRATVNYNGQKYYGIDSTGDMPLTMTDGDFPINNVGNISTTQLNTIGNSRWIPYLYGETSEPSETQEITVYADGTIGLNDVVDTADRNKETDVDYTDFLGVDAGTLSLSDVMDKVIEAINSGVATWADAIPVANIDIITPIINPVDVPIPLLFDGLPEIVSPECVGLGPCLLSGVQTVSQHLQSIYSSNGSVANYTLVSLAVGIALFILTGGL